MLYREPMWLKWGALRPSLSDMSVSVLYREPMWLKLIAVVGEQDDPVGFSALP